MSTFEIESADSSNDYRISNHSLPPAVELENNFSINFIQTPAYPIKPFNEFSWVSWHPAVTQKSAGYWDAVNMEKSRSGDPPSPQHNSIVPKSYQREGQPCKTENGFSHDRLTMIHRESDDLGKSKMAVLCVPQCWQWLFRLHWTVSSWNIDQQHKYINLQYGWTGTLY